MAVIRALILLLYLGIIKFKGNSDCSERCVTWYEALERCRETGGDLLSDVVTDKANNTWLGQFTTEKRGNESLVCDQYHACKAIVTKSTTGTYFNCDAKLTAFCKEDSNETHVLEEVTWFEAMNCTIADPIESNDTFNNSSLQNAALHWVDAAECIESTADHTVSDEVKCGYFNNGTLKFTNCSERRAYWCQNDTTIYQTTTESHEPVSKITTTITNAPDQEILDNVPVDNTQTTEENEFDILTYGDSDLDLTTDLYTETPSTLAQGNTTDTFGEMTNSIEDPTSVDNEKHESVAEFTKPSGDHSKSYSSTMAFEASKKDKDDNNNGTVIGIVIGTCIGLVVVVIVLVVAVYRKRFLADRKQPEEFELQSSNNCHLEVVTSNGPIYAQVNKSATKHSPKSVEEDIPVLLVANDQTINQPGINDDPHKTEPNKVTVVFNELSNMEPPTFLYESSNTDGDYNTVSLDTYEDGKISSDIVSVKDIARDREGVTYDKVDEGRDYDQLGLKEKRPKYTDENYDHVRLAVKEQEGVYDHTTYNINKAPSVDQKHYDKIRFS